MTDTKKTDLPEITLGDGRKAAIRKGKGRDLLTASRMAGGTNEPMKIAYGLIAALATVDGKPLTIEDVEDMDLGDVLKLQGEVMGNGGSLPGITSPS
ncbi:phage tail assembly protein [Ectothiorhodospira mobilis]|uniref:phage tail assembly protein n=1 Tax=Ectothiorhodospira mobilis TaxID=195064 RepID=UPI001F5BD17C|nr:phage tail assembly protein [Ectothiorhodospira mobilis]